MFLSGRSEKNQCQQKKLFIEKNINNFGNFLNVCNDFFYRQYDFGNTLKNNIFKNKYKFIEFYDSNRQGLLYWRKQIILKQLSELSSEYNIHYYGNNKNDIYDLNCKGYLENKNSQEIFLRSKIIITMTPLHLSFINERVNLALNTHTIPIVEPYPQYKKLAVPNNYFFNYDKNNLKNVLEKILNNYEIDKHIFDNFIKNISL